MMGPQIQYCNNLLKGPLPRSYVCVCLLCIYVRFGLATQPKPKVAWLRIYSKPSFPELGHEAVDEINTFADKSLQPEKSTEMVVHYYDEQGRRRCHGGKDLKSSQAYPLGLLDNAHQHNFMPIAPCLFFLPTLNK